MNHMKGKEFRYDTVVYIHVDAGYPPADPKGNQGVITPVTLIYNADEPWEIAFAFHGLASDIVWKIDRVILAEGLMKPSGEGDVHVRPNPHRKGEIIIVLSDGKVWSETMWNASEIAYFLDHTYEIVPAGEEKYDWDTTIQQLLESGKSS